MAPPVPRLRLEEGSTAIRPFAAADVDAVHELVLGSRDHAGPWEPARPAVYFTRQGQADAVRRDIDSWDLGTGYAFAIVDLADDAVVGRIALANVVRGAWENATLGYMVAADRTGRGHATTAVRLTVRFGFEHAGLHRIQPAVIPRNTPSIRVVEKAGFRLEGRALKYLRINGAWEDHDIFALTSEDWAARTGPDGRPAP